MQLFKKEVHAGRVATVLFWTFVITLAANLVYMSRKAIRPALAQPNVFSYTTTLTEIPITAKGQAGQANYYTFGVRSDGSTVIKTNIRGDITRIIEFASRVQVRVRDFRELKSSIAMSAIPIRRDPNQSCAYSGEASLGEENVTGYRAVRLGKGERTSWYALDYGCALVREVWKFQTGEVSEKTLVSLVRGEPDPALFHVPNAYPDVPPSQLVGKSANIPGYARRDKYYYEHRPAAIPQ